MSYKVLGNCIYHSGERAGHKYIARVKLNGSDRYRYFYNSNEYEAYLNSNKGNVSKTSVTEYNNDGSVKNSTNTKHDTKDPSASKETKESFNGNNEKTVEVTSSNSSGYETTTTTYVNKGRNFIDKLLKLPYWNEKKSSSAKGYYTNF